MSIPVYLVEAGPNMGAVSLPGEKGGYPGRRIACEGEGTRIYGSRAARNLKGPIKALTAVIEVKVDAVAVIGVQGGSEKGKQLTGGDTGFGRGDNLGGVIDAGRNENSHIANHMPDFAASTILFDKDGHIIDAYLLRRIPCDKPRLGVYEEVSTESAGELIVSDGDGVLHGAGIILLRRDKGKDKRIAIRIISAGVVGPEAVSAGIINGVIEENGGIIAAEEGVVDELSLYVEGGSAGVCHISHIIHAGKVGEAYFVQAGSGQGDGSDVKVFLDAGAQADAQAGGGRAASPAGAIGAGDTLEDLNERFGISGDAPYFQVDLASVDAGSRRIGISGERDSVLVGTDTLSGDLTGKVMRGPGKPDEPEPL